MKGRVVWVPVLLAVWALGAGGDGAAPGASRVPPEVAAALPHAVNLWRASVLAPFGGRRVDVLAVADLTGDGREDVVVSDHQTILVFAAQPDGTFGERYGGFYEVTWAPDRSYYTVTGSVRPWTGVPVDLDSDGALDLVVGASGARHEIHLFRNTGRGGLDKVAALEVPRPPHELWVADFTGDGVLDLLWFTEKPVQEGELFLHVGLGGFAFGEAVPLGPVRGRPLGLADLDGDGFLDLAFYAPEGAGVLFGTGRGFGRETFWESTVGAVNHGVLHPRKAAEAVLATDQGLVVLQLAWTGLALRMVVPLGPCSWAHLLDLTGDGQEDALVLHRGRWRVLPAGPTEDFLPPTSEFLLPGPLALTRGSLSTLRFEGETALVVGTTPFPTVFRTGHPPAGETLIPIEGSYLLAVGDLSGDGAPELVVEGATGVDVLWNDGRGGFVRRPLLEAPLRVVQAAVGARGLYLLGLAERPRDRMATELWTVSPSGEVLVREVLEVFAPPAGNAVQPVLIPADLDADGAEDVLLLRRDAVLVSWGGQGWRTYPWEEGFLGLAAGGRFTQKALPEVALLSDAGLFFLTFPARELAVRMRMPKLPGFPLDLARGDLDGDGLDDLVLLALDMELAVSLERKELTARIRGSWGWAIPSAGAGGPFALPLGEEDAPWPLTGLVVAELTGDGVADAAFTTVRGAGVYVLPGRGDGMFAGPVRLARNVGPLFAADLDGNGQADLVGSTLGFNPHLWLRWNGGGR